MALDSDGQVGDLAAGDESPESQVTRLRTELNAVREENRVLRSSLAERDSFLEKLNMGMVVLSPDLQAIWTNSYLNTMFNVGDPVGRHCYEYMHDRSEVCEDCATLRALVTGQIVESVKLHPEKGRYYRVRSSPVFDTTSGKPTSILQTIVDITDQRHLENELLLAQFSIEHCNDMVFWVTRDARYAYANRAASKHLGYTREEFSKLSVYDINPSTNEAGWLAKWNESKESGQDILETVFRAKDGTLIDVEVTVNYFEYEGREYHFTFARDLTRRRNDEKALHKSEQCLDLAMNAVNDAVWDWDLTTGTVFVTSQYYRMLGYDPDAFVVNYEMFRTLVHPDDLAHIEREVRGVVGGSADHYAVEFRMKTKTNDWLWVLTRGRVTEWDESGNPVRVIGTHSDISERKRAEEALKASEDRYKLAIEATSDSLWDWDVATGSIFVTPRFYAILGYEDGAFPFTFDKLVEFLHPDDRGATVNRILARVEQCIPDFILEFRLVARSGTYRWVLARGKVVGWSRDGRATRLVGTFSDITGRKQSEQALGESERRFRSLLESVNLLAVILDEYGRVTFCNDCVLRTTNWRREEVLGGNWFDFFLPVEDRLREQQGFLDTLASGAPKPGFENVIMTRDGERRYVAWDSTLLRSPEGAVVGLAAVGRDITEQRTLEEQYRQAQKMEAVGLLAGGVAHDFNNLLSVIIGYSDILSMRLQPGDLTYEEIQEIRLAGGRARDLTRQLLAFSRKQVLEVRLLDVNHIIAGWEKLLRRLIGETIEVRTNTISTGLVKADPTQLELILMNLAVNARDAMPGGGTLSIETEDVTLDAEYTRMHVGVRPGRYVMLAVSDTGFGMDEQTMRRVFEPFFTTKEKGKGTGLGLATVYGIVKQHGGDIWLYSEPGQGTTFKVYLPAVQEEMDGAIPVPNTIHKDYCGSERVLVVEDDPSLRKLVCAILASAGYAVIETQNSLDAVDRAMEDGLIDIMVSDVVMPKMNGQEVYEKVKFLQPQIKVLFMSGYTENIIAEHGIREHTIQILQKPFVAEDLLRKVREVLDY